MNIWLIQIGESLPLNDDAKEMRTGILAHKLVERGHSVVWWTSAYDHFEKKWIYGRDSEFEVEKNYNIVALKGLGYRKNVSFQRYLDHRIIAWKFRKMACCKLEPDVIIVSLPSYDLSYEAVKFGKERNIPVSVDIRDMWPDIFIEHFPVQLKRISKLFLYWDFRMVEFALRNATCIISMMDSVLEWGLQKASRTKSSLDRVFYLGARKKKIRSISKFEELARFLKISNTFVVTFIGTFGFYSQPISLVHAAKKLIHENIFFIIGGAGAYFKDVKNACSGLNNISLTGWLSEDEIIYLLSLSNLGIVICNVNTVAFPNKAFAYLSANLPIISGTSGDLKEIIEKYEIGFYYPPKNVDALVNSIRRLYEETELYKRMSENVRRVFDEMFDAEKIYEEYAKHIEKIVCEHRK